MNNTGFVLDESWHHSILHRWMLVAISYQYTLCITEGKWCQLLLDETMALLYSGACPLLRYTGLAFTEFHTHLGRIPISWLEFP